MDCQGYWGHYGKYRHPVGTLGAFVIIFNANTIIFDADVTIFHTEDGIVVHAGL